MYDKMFNILIKSPLNINAVFVKDLELERIFRFRGRHYGALLFDLPKALDCMMHDLIIVKQ